MTATAIAAAVTGIVRLVSLLLPLSCGSCAVAGSIYQWTDQQGVMHFADRAPLRIEHAEIRLSSPPAVRPTGLRPGETAALRDIEQQAARQQRRTRAARQRSARQVAGRQAACRENRKKLQQAHGKDDFKEYARFLRNNCW